MLLHDTQLPGTLALNQTLHPAPYTHPPQLPGTQALPRGQMVLTPDSWAREMEHPDRDFAFQVRGQDAHLFMHSRRSYTLGVSP